MDCYSNRDRIALQHSSTHRSENVAVAEWDCGEWQGMKFYLIRDGEQKISNRVELLKTRQNVPIDCWSIVKTLKLYVIDGGNVKNEFAVQVCRFSDSVNWQLVDNNFKFNLNYVLCCCWLFTILFWLEFPLWRRLFDISNIYLSALESCVIHQSNQIH